MIKKKPKKNKGRWGGGLDEDEEVKLEIRTASRPAGGGGGKKAPVGQKKKVSNKIKEGFRK